MWCSGVPSADISLSAQTGLTSWCSSSELQKLCEMRGVMNYSNSKGKACALKKMQTNGHEINKHQEFKHMWSADVLRYLFLIGRAAWPSPCVCNVSLAPWRNCQSCSRKQSRCRSHTPPRTTAHPSFAGPSGGLKEMRGGKRASYQKTRTCM